MQDEKLEEALVDCFSTKYKMDDRFKEKVLSEALDKERRKENIYVIVIQVLMMLLMISILAIGFVLNFGKIILILFITYMLCCSLVALIIIKKDKKFVQVVQG